MKLAILGGGGFRVPLVYGALLGTPTPVDAVCLYDTDAARLRAITAVLAQQAADRHTMDPHAANPPAGDRDTGDRMAPRVHATTDVDEALAGADLVFSAIRVGGLRGRTVDERVALDLGLLGQETTGPGGLAYALRTLPVALDLARRTRRLAPQAWFINFTNPAGIVTEAMQGLLGDRVIGICDSPTALARRAARVLGLDPASTRVDYVGLNHLGWLRGMEHGGRQVLPDLLGRPDLLEEMEEGRLFGASWLQALGAIPNEYLYYYYFTREALAGIQAAGRTRGELLLDQQSAFYAAAGQHPGEAYERWRAARAEREATYMQEARAHDEARAAEDLEGGGYEGVALAIMTAVTGGAPAELILDVRNGSTVPGLPADAVVEVPCSVGPGGARPRQLAAATGHQLGLMQQVKEVERLVIEAVTTRSEAAALKAFALHPLVDSVSTARALLEGYRRRSPELAAVFDG